MRLNRLRGLYVAGALVAILVCVGGAASAGSRDPYVSAVSEKGRLLISTDGRSWRDVTPRRTSYGFDSVAFADLNAGWVAWSDCAAGKAELWHTTSGGRSWTGKPAALFRHGCNAGQSVALDFMDSEHGWATALDLQSAQLYRTADGGATWQPVGGLLPDIGPVRFTSLTTGWLAGRNLYLTTDGGRNWEPERLPAPPGFVGKLQQVAPPTLAGASGLTVAAFGPGLYRRGRIVVASYRTTDLGRHWRPTVSWRAVVGASWIRMSAPTPEIAWLTVSGARPHFYVTIDGGRRWRDHLLKLKGVGRIIRITALDGSTAIAETAPDSGELFFVTHNGGNSWTPLPFK